MIQCNVIGAYESREAHSHKRPHELSQIMAFWLTDSDFSFEGKSLLKKKIDKRKNEDLEKLDGEALTAGYNKREKFKM